MLCLCENNRDCLPACLAACLAIRHVAFPPLPVRLERCVWLLKAADLAQQAW